MSDDLIERLRRTSFSGSVQGTLNDWNGDRAEAATALAEAQATIARQQVMLDRALENGGKLMIENARLREALRRIAEATDLYEPCGWAVHSARAALSPVAPDQGEGPKIPDTEK